MNFPIKLVPYGTTINFVKFRKYAFFFSASITLAVFILFFTKGLNLGIDFSGGIILELRSETSIEISSFREKLHNLGYTAATIQNFSPYDVMIRINGKEITNSNDLSNKIKTDVSSILDNRVEFRKIDFVGPRAGKELVNKGIQATFFALILMLIYIAFRFNWQFGVGALIALFHDALITLGFYIVTGSEFDISSIAAILAVVGYSINDSVVIYDRIRDNIRKNKNLALANLIDMSINETLSRTTITVLMTVVVCLSLVLFGGEVIKGFSAAVLFGIIFGTYSSIFISAPILLYTRLK